MQLRVAAGKKISVYKLVDNQSVYIWLNKIAKKQ